MWVGRKSFCMTCVGWMMSDVEAMLKERDRIIGKVRSYAAMEGLGELGTLQAAVRFALASACATVSDSRQAEAPTGDERETLHNAIRETVIRWEDCGGNIEHMLKESLSGFRLPVVPVPVYEYKLFNPKKSTKNILTHGAHLISDNREHVETQHRRGHPAIQFVRRVKAGSWELVPVNERKLK